MALKITFLNESGFSAPSWYEEPEDQTYISSAYEAVDNFSVDIKFEGEYDDGLGLGGVVYANAVNVTSTFDWSSIGLTMTKPNAYTARISGPAIDVFLNQYYKFTLTDYTEQILDYDTTTPFLSLNRYKMPSPTYIMKSYPFSVTIPTYSAGLPSGGNTTESVTMKQWILWVYSTAVANVNSCVSRGQK